MIKRCGRIECAECSHPDIPAAKNTATGRWSYWPLQFSEMVSLWLSPFFAAILSARFSQYRRLLALTLSLFFRRHSRIYARWAALACSFNFLSPPLPYSFLTVAGFLASIIIKQEKRKCNIFLRQILIARIHYISGGVIYGSARKI